MSGALLKIIACIAMALDHVGYLMQAHSVGDAQFAAWFRVAGRIAFPIFAFLIAEGFKKTRNVVFYTFRLFTAGIISEIPYNLCFYKTLVRRGSMNVMFTFALALLALTFADMCINSAKKEVRFLFVFPIASACYISRNLGVDYGYWGILLVFLFYVTSSNTTKRKLMLFPVIFLFAVRSVITDLIFTGNINNWSEFQLFAALSIVPLLLYNGKSGLKDSKRSFLKKYSFYLFYPAHLLVLWFIFSKINLF